MSAFQRRADLLDAALDAPGLDYLLVTNLVNVRYLTGFAGTNGLCVIGKGLREFFTDFRYVELARRDVTAWEVREGGRDMFKSAFELLPAGRVGFDDAHVTVKAHRRLKELAGDSAELVVAAGVVEALREVKDGEEIAAIRAAAGLADGLYTWLTTEHGLAGHTERAVAIALERRALELGTAMSFPPIVAAGQNSALPHAECRDIEIGRGELVVVDMGCVVDGYCSDCTRTFATGELSEDAAEVYELVRRAQLAALGRVRAGESGEGVDGAARELIDAAGHQSHFGHGTGHGVGLEVHEGPRVAPRVSATLSAGNVVTVEPGVYLPGQFGVRIEDLVVVEEGGSDVLTGISKELTIV